MSRTQTCYKLSGISLAAMAASIVAAPQHVQAQSFIGTPTTQSGSVNITTAPNTTNIVVNSPRAVINWDVGNPANSGPIIFQPVNTTANFFSSPVTNYIVLNRILPTDPTRAVQFNGTVNAPGNGVFFYSPGGIVLGSTAVFNVGRLLLTTNDVAVDGNGGFFQNNDISVSSLSSGSTSAVNINAGAQINALAQGSFVVAIAPRVIDSGTTVVNGTKALVAGEFVNMTYNAGLFDISVTQGTAASGEVIRHDGSTTGPASSGTGDFHRVYMVAIPSNTAISMFVSGANGLGFDVAGAADVVGNAIVLSGGSNVTEASSGTGGAPPFALTPATNTAADINLTGGNYTSSVNALSNNNAAINVNQAGPSNFASDVTVQARNNASLNITSGSVTVDGQLLISADAVSSINNGSLQQAGNASITITGIGSSLTTNNSASVFANGTGADSFSIGNGGDGRGGSAQVQLNGGTWIANGGLRTQANGIGGQGNTGGGGFGGSANINSNNGNLSVFGGFYSEANGIGGGGLQTGGVGQGGTAIAQVSGGDGIINVSQADQLFVSASGQGGSNTISTNGNGGNGTGGTASLLATSGGQFSSSVLVNQIDASGSGGSGSVSPGLNWVGGVGTGGTVNVRADTAGAIRLNGAGSATVFNAFGLGGQANTGGNAIGGTQSILVSTGSTLFVESSQFNASVSAFGGFGQNSNGGAATGGNLTTDFNGTTEFAGAVTFEANGTGGAGANVGGSVPNGVGGSGTGGSALVRSAGTTAFSSDSSALQILANSVGGTGFVGGNGVGSATGQASLTMNAGTTILGGGITASASGTGGVASGFGADAIGGNGTGSNAAITANGGVLTNTFGFSTFATGLGGSGNIGGIGTGGTARLSLNNGQIGIQGTVETDASGRGGQGINQGGDAFGGAASVRTSGAGGSLNISNADLFTLSASATGGDLLSSVSTGSGGNATAGATDLSASNGSAITITVSSIDVNSSAEGGFGQSGTGGNAAAGTAQIQALSGGTVSLTGNARTSLSANAVGGAGPIGGTATGGTANVITEIASNLAVGSAFELNGSADGGAGSNGDGGAAAGGTVLLNTQGTVNVTGGLRLNGNGNGGTSANGGNGGAGTGGFTRLLSAGNTAIGLVLDATSNGSGGNGINGGAGTGGQTGGTQVVISGGTFTASSDVLLDSSSLGGDGRGFGNGGAALGGRALFSVTGGNANLASVLNLNGLATGGAGRNGGNAAAGFANVVLSGGSLNITGTSSLSTDGSGGDASAGLGGTGGNGTGGASGVTVNNSSANVTLTAGNVLALSRGIGGIGGDASMAMLALGLPLLGGNGGNGIGGSSFIGSPNSAGNLNLGGANAVAAAAGGNGGSGGTFGPGGNGGNARGGNARLGFEAASATATGTMNTIGAAANSTGTGGAGGTGTAGGNGGNAFGGTSSYGNAAGGILVNAGQATINANGIGGAGVIAGMGEGGNALLGTSPNPNAGGGSSLTTGFAAVLASGVRRVATAAGIINQPIGRYGRSAIIANGGNVQSGSTNVFALGSAGPSTVPNAFGIINSGLVARNAQLSLTGLFNGQFSGDAALSADGGNINYVANAAPGATGFNFNTPGNIFNSLTGAAPTGTGQVTSTTFLNINAGGNLLTPNNIYVSQLQTTLTAGGSLFAGGVNAVGRIFLQSGGIMNVGNIIGQDELEAVSGAAMILGNVRTTSDTDLTAAGAVTTGTISSGDTVTIGSGATITTGNIDAGIVNPSADPAAAYAVGLRGVGNVTTGSITAVNRIGLGSNTGAITTGAIGTGEFFLALAATGVTVNGGITTGTGANGITYIADASMLALINPVTLDPAPVFASAPVRLNGNVAITGPVTTGRFASASTGTFTAGGNIAAANADTAAGPALFISSGGNVAAQSLSAALGDVTVTGNGAIITNDILSGGDVSLGSTVGAAANSITTAQITATGDVTLFADGPIIAGNTNAGGFIEVDPNAGNATLGNLRAGQFVRVESEGDVVTGNVSAGDYIEFSGEVGAVNSVTTGTLDAGIVNPSVNSAATFNVGIRATNNINTGAVNSRGSSAFISDQGSVNTGNINTQGFLLALARTGASLGSIATGTGAGGVTFIGNSSVQTDPNFDPVNLDTNPAIAAILAGTPARVAGPVAITGPVTTGRFASASTGTFTAGGNITAANADTAAGSALFISSGGNVAAQNLTAGAGSVNINGDANITAANINGATGVNVLGAGIVNGGNVTSGGAVSFASQDAINTGAIQAGAAINLSSNAAVTTNGVNGSSSFAVNAAGNIATGAITVNNQISLISRAGAISAGAVNTGQYFLALADSGVTVNGGITTGTGANGVTYIANSTMTDFLDPVTQDPTALFNAAPTRLNGNVAITGPVSTGRFVSGGSGSFTAGSAINANTSALISAGGLATFTGIVNAPVINLTSGGVDIGANGGLGTASTSTLNINAELGVSAIRLGGDAGTGYVIDANEMARLRAQNIRFRAGGTAAPLLTIGSFTLQGSAGAPSNLIGGSGAFSIETNGSVRVTGAAVIDGAAAGNAFSINAGGRIDVVNDLGGSIRLSDAAGEPSGILNLTAGTISSASDSLITQLTQDANFAGRDAALDAAATTPLEQGYLGAGTMNISVSSGLFIQNSNTAQLRGGYSVGTGGLNVTANNASGPPVNLVVNGRALQTNGTFLTNKDALDAATFTSLSQFAPGATLNGCLITGAPCVIFSDGVLQYVSTQQANAIDNTDEDEDLVAIGEAQPIVFVDSLVPDPAASAQPKVTEPVTGSGNSESWSQSPSTTGEQP